MGFVATEAVEELTYDFKPHVDAAGVIPEPSSKAIQKFTKATLRIAKNSGLSAEVLEGGNNLTLDQMEALLDQSGPAEDEILVAVADLTGIAPATLRALPHRIKNAFVGWVMGQFINPEA